MAAGVQSYSVLAPQLQEESCAECALLFLHSLCMVIYTFFQRMFSENETLSSRIPIDAFLMKWGYPVIHWGRNQNCQAWLTQLDQLPTPAKIAAYRAFQVHHRIKIVTDPRRPACDDLLYDRVLLEMIKLRPRDPVVIGALWEWRAQQIHHRHNMLD